MGDRTPDWSFDQLAELERPAASGHHCADGNPQHGRGFPRWYKFGRDPAIPSRPAPLAIDALKLQRRNIRPDHVRATIPSGVLGVEDRDRGPRRCLSIPIG
jgi:hypothetical protein